MQAGAYSWLCLPTPCGAFKLKAIPIMAAITPVFPVLNLCIILCVFCLCLSYSEMLAFTLTAFLELMDHGIVSWDMVSITFIKQVRPPAFHLPLLPLWPVVLSVYGEMQARQSSY